MNYYRTYPRVVIPITSTNDLDNWIIYELNCVADKIDEYMSTYKINCAVNKALEFIDLLSNHYIRLSLKRLNGEKGVEEQAMAVSTLKHVLINYNIIMAPFAPFTSEKHHKELVNDRSVLFSRFNRIECMKNNDIDVMIKVIDIVRQMRAKNEKYASTSVQISAIYVIYDTILPDTILEIIREEVNCLVIDSIKFEEDCTYSIKFDFAKLGKKYGKQASFIKTYSYNQLIIKQLYETGSFLLQQGLTITSDDVIITREKKIPFLYEGLVCEKIDDVAVYIDQNDLLIHNAIASDIASATRKLCIKYKLTDNIEIYYSGENIDIISARMHSWFKHAKTMLGIPADYTCKDEYNGTTIYIRQV
jgi:isoleucyl-tRNA synthetase